MTCSSCERKRKPLTVHCEAKKSKICKDCCINTGGIGCRWWVVCW